MGPNPSHFPVSERERGDAEVRNVGGKRPFFKEHADSFGEEFSNLSPEFNSMGRGGE